MELVEKREVLHLADAYVLRFAEHKRFCDAVEGLKTVTKEQSLKWKDAKKAPKEEGEYLILTDSNIRKVATFKMDSLTDNFVWLDFNSSALGEAIENVIAWMPIPEYKN